MELKKVTGRTVIVDQQVYIITCDKALPRHYTTAGIFLLALMIPQLLKGENLDAILYAGFIGLATLALAWLFDDRDTYRLRWIMDLQMPRASEEPEPSQT